MTEVEIPKAFQELFKPNRYKIYYGGRGGAKSWNFARALLLIGTQRPMQILCARELQNSIKESVHLLLTNQIESMGLSQHYEVLATEIRGANGTRFVFEGIKHNTDKIKSMEGIDVVWVEEADKVSNQSWSVLIPTIRKPGSEIWVSFNPGTEHDPTYKRFVRTPPEGAVVKKVSHRDNPWFSQEMRAEMDSLKASDEEEYLHVWEGELKTIADGAIFGKQILKAKADKRITVVPIESGVPVNTFWDLGKNDATAIWFHQRVGLQNRFIGYYEDRLVDLEVYFRELKRRSHLYGDHYLPHDVDFEILGMQNTRKQQMEAAGVRPIIVVPRINDVNEGIEMTRRLFGSCWFDEKGCEDGLAALSNYKYTFDETNATFRRAPLHNWASNGADAFRQFGQGYTPKDKPTKIVYPKMDYA